MTPNEAGRELARAAAIVRSAGRQIAIWKVAAFGVPVLSLVLIAVWLPSGRLAGAGSVLPMLLGVGGLAALGAAGLATGLSVRACRLRRGVAEVERARGLAHGELLGALELGKGPLDPGGLANLHRGQVAAALAGSAKPELLPVSYRQLRRVRRFSLSGLGLLAAALLVGFLDHPASGFEGVTSLLRPWTVAFPPPPPAIRVSPSGGEVLRGGSFEVVITAVSRSRAFLGQERPGMPSRWDTLAVAAGLATGRIDPVDEAIRFWAEDDRGSVSDTFVVIPLDPLMLTDLRIELEYPSYLGHPRDALSGPIGELRVPSGTVLHLSARTNHGVDRLGLIGVGTAGRDTLFLDLSGNQASGSLQATKTAVLSWLMDAAGIVPGIATPPPIELAVEPDGPPAVTLLYPGHDRLLGLDRTLPLVIEAQDDHGLEAVGLTWWRESTGGRRDTPVYEPLYEGAGERRLVVRPILDFADSGLLPGDEVVYFASAADARPGSGVSVSDTFRARFSSLEEVRDEMARRAESIADDTRALTERVSELSDAARDAERRTASRSLDPQSAGASGDRPDFGATQEARDLLAEAGEIEAELTRVHEELRQASTGLDGSSLVDPDLQRRLGELERLFEEILASGLREKIEALEQSLRGLDREDLQHSLSEVSRQSRDLEDRLDQALGLLERVALEQSLESVRQQAHELALRQEREATGGQSGENREERQAGLAAQADSLAQRVAQVSERLADQQAPDAAERAAEAARDARRSATSMREAARQAGGDAVMADEASSREARVAAAEMQSAERRLEAASQSLAEDWRAEAMQAVERATSEALELAREQEGIVEQLRSGQPTEDLPARQSAVRQGLDNLSQSLADAGRRTALMDRRAGPAAARAEEQMDAAANSLSGGAARGREAAQQGQAAMDALGDLAGALMSSRRAMAEASSATGLEEALEKIAGMGRRQGGVNAESGELFLLMQGGQPIEDRLRALALRQEAVSRELQDLAGDPGAADLTGRPQELAGEADELARRLSAGVLDRETLSRQERLFQRLLDAGRSLEKEERDASRRESTSAGPGLVRLPATEHDIESGPRYPYPGGESMEGLSVSQRRMVYDYFDLLNRVSP